MIALTEAGLVAISSAALSAATLILVALIGRGARKRAERAVSDRGAIIEAVKPTNGHDSLGAGLAAIEDRLVAGDQRFDRIEVKLDEQTERFNEHIEAVAPLTEWVDVQMRKRKGK